MLTLFILILVFLTCAKCLKIVCFSVFAQKAQRPENIYVPRGKVRKGKSEVHPENLSSNPKADLLR